MSFLSVKHLILLIVIYCETFSFITAFIIGDVVDVSDLPMNLVAALMSVSTSLHRGRTFECTYVCTFVP